MIVYDFKNYEKEKKKNRERSQQNQEIKKFRRESHSPLKVQTLSVTKISFR